MARLNESRTSALLTEPFAAAFSYSAAATPHAEHATMIFIGIDADVVVGLARGRILIVPPGTPYSAHCPGPIATYYFDPEMWPRIAGFAKSGGIRTMDNRHAGGVLANRAALVRPDVLAGVGSELARSFSTGEPQRLDRRIARLIEELRDPQADRSAALARVRVSPAHLQALFVRDIGLPIRTYGLWRRLLHAIGHVGPLDLTASAHAAGFADLAHFSRTCRRMLGYSPNEFRLNLVRG